MNLKYKRLLTTIATVSLWAICSSRTSWAKEADVPGGPSFPNDAGVTKLDVSMYPIDIQEDYRVFARRCSECHTLARPLNSQFLQLTADEQAKAKLKDPELFKDDRIWHINNTVWTDYVKRMQGKPGATIRPSELDNIIAFLVFDSKVRKMGTRRDAWRVSRQKLLDDFRKADPKRYSEIFNQ
jgi:hypothetical protein